MSEVLTITKERVLKAAEQCKDVKEVLKTLFPDAFPTSPCCYSFGTAISDGSIRVGDSGYFVFGEHWVFSYCPFCSKIVR